MSSSFMSKENLSSKRSISLVALVENCGKNTGIAVVDNECDSPSSRKSLRLQGFSGISLSPQKLKTSESSSEHFGENPGYKQIAQVRRQKTLQSLQSFTREVYIGFVSTLLHLCISGEDEKRKKERGVKNRRN